MTIAIIAVIALATAFIIAALIDVVRTVRNAKKDSGKPLRNPKDCDHEWVVSECASCTPSYSSYSGPDPQETWRVERCLHCGAQQFSCTGTCDCCFKCAATYEGEAL